LRQQKVENRIEPKNCKKKLYRIMKRILIVGAGGQIGSELTVYLRSIYGESNVVASDMRECPALGESGPFEHLDALDTKAFAEIVSKYKIDAIFNLVALLSATGEKIPQKAWNRLQHGSTVELDGRVYTPDMVMGAPRKGLKVTYCTDSRPVKSISENAQGSDLFICEGMYGEKGKESKAREYKHMTFVEAAHLAREAQVKEMWLTHFSPSLVRPADYVAGIQKIFPNVQAGTDGKTVELGFED
jgi:ribonuclease BN (tRNA processing enzyme)